MADNHPEIYKKRRALLAKTIKDGLVVLPAGLCKTRSHDTEFTFRQNSQFQYLTGLNEEAAILVIKITGGKTHETLFVKELDEVARVWTGKGMELKEARELLQVEAALPIGKFSEELPKLMVDHPSVYFDLHNREVMSQVLAASKKQKLPRNKRTCREIGLIHLSPFIGRQRLIKEESEISLMTKAASASKVAHAGAMAYTAPEKNEGDVANLLDYLFRQEGADGHAYTSIVAGGKNGLILHYIDNNAALKDGELLLIDAGAEVNCYASDVSRTFPINGRFNSAQKEIYTLVLNAQKKAIGLARPGKTLTQIHNAATLALIEGMVDLKILSGDPQELLQSKKHAPYYPHGTSHWLGLDVHDECPYMAEDEREVVLQAGMAFTVEPGLYFPQNDSQIPAWYRGLAVRIEDDVLVTQDSHRILTADIPKEIPAVEEACSEDYRQFIL